ncbi:hypothetical protein Vretimale_16764, partial [Volvox reticuliferus]
GKVAETIGPPVLLRILHPRCRSRCAGCGAGVIRLVMCAIMCINHYCRTVLLPFQLLVAAWPERRPARGEGGGGKRTYHTSIHRAGVAPLTKLCVCVCKRGVAPHGQCAALHTHEGGGMMRMETRGGGWCAGQLGLAALAASQKGRPSIAAANMLLVVILVVVVVLVVVLLLDVPPHLTPDGTSLRLCVCVYMCLHVCMLVCSYTSPNTLTLIEQINLPLSRQYSAARSVVRNPTHSYSSCRILGHSSSCIWRYLLPQLLYIPLLPCSPPWPLGGPEREEKVFTSSLSSKVNTNL